jgi:tRNA-modifying protein YgfZ
VSNTSLHECTVVPLEPLGVLRVRGADAVSFLQGQLSNDLLRVGGDRAVLAGYHNPQGRVIAMLRVLQLAGDDLLAILPRELVASVAQRLGKFVLRSKVKLADESARWAISGLIEPTRTANAVAGLPSAINEVAPLGAALAVCIAQRPARWLLLNPASEPSPFAASSLGDIGLWERLAIAGGEPEVYAATSEAFVAQMLNLDALDAIAFDKGCYTGQEVIARAHYRGRVKRRMQRFLTDERSSLKPADAGVLADGRSLIVVRAAEQSDGRCEFLAVAVVDAAANTAEPAAGAGADRAAGTSRVISASRLELPYTLPDQS